MRLLRYAPLEKRILEVHFPELDVQRRLVLPFLHLVSAWRMRIHLYHVHSHYLLRRLANLADVKLLGLVSDWLHFEIVGSCIFLLLVLLLLIFYDLFRALNVGHVYEKVFGHEKALLVLIVLLERAKARYLLVLFSLTRIWVVFVLLFRDKESPDFDFSFFGRELNSVAYDIYQDLSNPCFINFDEARNPPSNLETDVYLFLPSFPLEEASCFS